MPLPALLAGVIPGLLKSVLDVGKTVIERKIPDKAAQAEAKRDFELAIKQFEQQQESSWNEYMLQYEGAAEDQGPVIRFLRGSVRPVLTYAFAAVFVWAFVHPGDFNSDLVELLWQLNLLTLGFWFGGRTLEKLGLNASGISKIRQARRPFDEAAQEERTKAEEDRRRLEARLEQIDRDRQRESRELERLRLENATLVVDRKGPVAAAKPTVPVERASTAAITEAADISALVVPTAPAGGSGFRFSERSQKRLATVREDLQRVAHRALQTSPYDFAVIEGIRSEERQRELYEKGASKTLNSRHLSGHAMDFMVFVDGRGTWEKPYYDEVGAVCKQAAAELGVDIQWGGEFAGFYDGGHIELNRQRYPA